MAIPDLPADNLTPMQPLIGDATLAEAAENMLVASRTMLAAASALAPGAGMADMRLRELTTEAIEAGFLRALRRDSLLGGAEGSTAAPYLFGLPTSRGLPGAGYGRMGASVTGHGGRAQLYGTIGGALGYALGGPVGAVIGGMLGGLLGGDDDEAERARQQQELARQWLNTPEGFEIEAYLYNLARGGRTSSLMSDLLFGGQTAGRATSLRLASSPVIVNFSPGAVQITGSGAEAGERAARAFAGELGRVLRLNSVVVPAAAFGGEP